MMSDILTKIRALIQDIPKSDFQIFTYSISNVFKLAEPNIEEVTQVLIRGTILGSGQSFSFDEDNNEVTVSGVTFNVNDPIEVRFTFTKYSDEELTQYIQAALSWLNIYGVGEEELEIDDDEISPEITKAQEDLIALVCSILICPDFQSYKLPNVSITYPSLMPKEERIARLITRFQHDAGASDVIEWGDFGTTQI